VTAQTATVVMSVTIAAATMAASSTLASREVIKRVGPVLEETQRVSERERTRDASSANWHFARSCSATPPGAPTCSQG